MGIDQSYTCTGVVIIDTSNHNKVIHHDVYATSKDEHPLEKFKRAHDIASWIMDVAFNHSVEQINIEGLAFAATTNATRDLAGLQYVIVTKVMETDITINVITPTSLKKLSTGDGRAKKEQMVDAVQSHNINFYEILMAYKKTKGRYDVADAYWLANYAE